MMFEFDSLTEQKAKLTKDQQIAFYETSGNYT